MTDECFRLELGNKLDNVYKTFKRAIDCDLAELDSVLDCYASPIEQKGWWPHIPMAPDPVDTYRACREFLEDVDSDTELTTAQYIRRALADKEEGSSATFQFIKTLAEYLQKNECGEPK